MGLVAAPAQAGGLSPVVATPAPTAPANAPATPIERASWNGGYVGVQLSYGSGDVNEALGDSRSTGGFYGAVSGYRCDFGRIVLGGEVAQHRFDADGTDADLTTFTGRIAYRF